MPWVEVFAVFVVSHLVGDFLLQTDSQATLKKGGLGQSGPSRRALYSHVAVYTLAFVPALIWLGDELGAEVLLIAALIALTHLLLDDARFLNAYARAVKRTELKENPMLALAVDQSFHVLVLLGVALLTQV